MDDFFDRWGSGSDAVSNATEIEKEWLLFIHNTLDETLNHIERVQTSLVGQYIHDYNNDDDTALNFVLSNALGKLKDHFLFIAVSCLESDDDESFPYNFFTDIRYIASDVGDESISENDVEEIRQLHEIFPEGMSLAIPQGASNIEEQLLSLFAKDFSRRLDTAMDKKPSIAVVEIS